MPTTFTAYAVLGVKLDRERVVKKELLPVYEHSYSKDFQFDPRTGEKLWREAEYCVFDPTKHISDVDRVSGFKLLVGSESCYLGLMAGSRVVKDTFYMEKDFIRFEDGQSLDDIKKKLKKVLESFDLWTEKRFGIWAVLDAC